MDCRIDKDEETACKKNKPNSRREGKNIPFGATDTQIARKYLSTYLLIPRWHSLSLNRKNLQIGSLNL